MAAYNSKVRVVEAPRREREQIIKATVKAIKRMLIEYRNGIVPAEIVEYEDIDMEIYDDIL